MFNMTRIERDLERYAGECGPEPQIDPLWMRSDYAAQCRAWREWWLKWYERPLEPDRAA